jgi:hypothetical protein
MRRRDAGVRDRRSIQPSRLARTKGGLMACSMAISTNPAEAADFRARSGAKVTLTLRAERNVVAKLLSVQYADQPIDVVDPLQFDVKPGRQPLFITYSASRPGAILQLLEVCGPDQFQALRTFFFDPSAPGKGFFVVGVNA